MLKEPARTPLMLREAVYVHNRAGKTSLRSIVVHLRLRSHLLAVKPDQTHEKQAVLPKKKKGMRRPKEMENEQWSWEYHLIVLSIIWATKKLAIMI